MGSTTTDNIPYWNVNVPPDQQTETCPDFLANVSDKDRTTLSTPDADCHVDSWAEVRGKVASGRIDLFRRRPSDFRRYLAYTWRLRQEYGSVKAFLLERRLGWREPLVPRGRRPFECEEEDVRVLCNDWPYLVDPRIVHLVVWVKFALPEDPATGHLTEETKAEIEAYVDRTFRARMKPDHVVWFRNWASIKSVHSIEHFHVMLFDPDPGFVQEITHGDVPMSQRPDGNP
ncbi:hypothetical protein VTK73DRAFT_6187 [Phialemonium thermophilum]|uniref:N-acetylglucosamine-induced protein 1 n=1 Tax=Phialemonium thermophilum TaxID=223376 RepID=A0ABR3WKF5_9PEZI